MRHRVKSRTLGRPQGHRISMLRNMARSLIRHRRITTTEARAKELSSFVEKLITSAIKAHQAETPAETLAHKRRVFTELKTSVSNASRRARGMKSQRPDRELAQQLFDHIAPLYAKGGSLERDKGGYTRVIRLYPRKGDGASMALIELVGGQ